jgi:hypothetical protein
MIAIAPKTITIHSRDFAQAAASEEGMRGMSDGAKAVAMTVTDLLAHPDLLARVKEEFFRTA